MWQGVRRQQKYLAAVCNKDFKHNCYLPHTKKRKKEKKKKGIRKPEILAAILTWHNCTI
jgi:hypothetical protein